ncbi:hypothetical protein [Streptomyces sp. TP-A0874]|uniref:hypothetical protein n=1 Tax=Streptomyces sp. TP-A0874 TaxID=549819 RepID=UPI00147C6E62|nr:hypothetical protein [Streptomyces sp. TP-A0874]
MTKRTRVDGLKPIRRESAVSLRSGLSTRSVTALAVQLADREGPDAVTFAASPPKRA